MILSFSEARLVGKFPLPNVNTTLFHNNGKLSGIFEPKSKFMIEHGIQWILQSDRWDIGGLYLIGEDVVFGKFRVDWDLYELQVNEGTAPSNDGALLAVKLLWLVLFPDEAELGSLDVLNIGPDHFADWALAFSVLALVEELIADAPHGPTTVGFLIEKNQHFLILP